MSQSKNWTISRTARHIKKTAETQLDLHKRYLVAQQQIIENIVNARWEGYKVRNVNDELSQVTNADTVNSLEKVIAFFGEADPDVEFPLDIEDCGLVGITTQSDFITAVEELERLASEKLSPIDGEPLGI